MDGWIPYNLDLTPDIVSQKGLVALILYLLNFFRLQESAKRADFISFFFLSFRSHCNFMLSVFLLWPIPVINQ